MQHDARYPWEEPGAGNPHARICEGESRMAELLDHARIGIGPEQPGSIAIVSRISQNHGGPSYSLEWRLWWVKHN